VDGRHAIITDTHVTPANVHDSVPYLGRLDRQRERFGFSIRAVGVDAGYAAAAITQGLEERNIYGVIGYRTPTPSRGLFLQAPVPLRREARCLYLPRRTAAQLPDHESRRLPPVPLRPRAVRQLPATAQVHAERERHQGGDPARGRRAGSGWTSTG
jgi:hypothetical protein